ncbi:MAG: hypothetical protein KJ907_12515 [Actinobacteria bacterium]|nr:hypothetical protein [Actinomycetota bacterium]MCG2818352.1 hypothetical protein [Actinomycetes bacterium]MBU4359734.1 hypothetical protein [Actinomycetota bacterium]MBU4391270.1 hypothetical protein [Actinomycetota bacterium]MBU4403539.1 hypothetical protein [Actinomycetota bacterium]
MYLQKKAVEELPSVKLKISWTVFKAFATNKPWLIAIGISLVGGAFYSIAILLAPISVVQPIVASGIALLAYLAMKNLGERPGKADLYAIGVTVLGVILIGVSLAEGIPPEAEHDPVVLWIFAGVVALVAIIVPFLMRGGGNRQAAGLGISVGLLFGIAAIFARLLLLDWSNQFSARGVSVLFVSIFLIGWALTLIPAFIMLQAALQRGMAVVVVPIVAGLSQLIPILGGMIALNEPFPESGVLTAVRILAFALILGATVVLARTAEESSPATA